MLTIPWTDDKGVGASSEEEPYDSDLIESDVEAELYSVIHHEQNNTVNIENSDQSLTNFIIKKEYSRRSDCKDFHKYASFLASPENSFSKNLVNNSSSIPIIDSPSINIESKDRFPFTKYKNFLGNSFDYSGTIFCNNLNTSLDSSNKNEMKKSSSLNCHKRQSDSDKNNLSDLQPCKKLKGNKPNIHEVKNESCSVVIVNSSEDEDSDVIPIEPAKQQFETNVSHESILIDSDSSSDSCFFKFTNKSFESTPSTSKNKDQWFVNDRDIYRSRRNSGRYHEHQTIVCTICTQKGHSSKFCSFTKGAKCYICGEKHFASKCKNRVCARCLNFNHGSKHCTKRLIICERCNMQGHHYSQCPDLWRSFHRTTTKKKRLSAVYFQDTPIFCYNCGCPGHFGGVCKQYRMSAHTFPTWPFVLNYRQMGRHNKPSDNGSVKKKRNKKGMKNSKIVKTPDISQQTNSPKTPDVSIASTPKNRATRRAEKKLRKKENRKLRKSFQNLNSEETGGIQQIELPDTPNISQTSSSNEIADSSKTNEESIYMQLSSKEKKKLQYRLRRKEGRKVKRLNRIERKKLLQLKQNNSIEN